MVLLLLLGLAMQEPLDDEVAELLREEMETAALVERLARLGREAAVPIARQLVTEASRDGAAAAALADALARLDARGAVRPILLDALRDRRTPIANRVHMAEAFLKLHALDPDALDDAEVPAEVRMTIAEGLWRRGELAPVENVLRALDRVRRDDAAMAARAAALEARLKRREDPESLVIDLPDPPGPAAPADEEAGEAESPAPERPRGVNANLLLLAGAAALVAALLAVRRAP